MMPAKAVVSKETALGWPPSKGHVPFVCTGLYLDRAGDTTESIHFQSQLLIPSHFPSHLCASQSPILCQTWKAFWEVRALHTSVCALGDTVLHMHDSFPQEGSLSLDHCGDGSTGSLRKNKGSSFYCLNLCVCF